jgi:hypothetical protein
MSETDFKLLSTSGLTAAVRQEKFTVCLDSGRKDYELWRDQVNKAILSWVRPLREVTRHNLVSNVEIIQSEQECRGQQALDAIVVFGDSVSRSHTFPARRPRVYMDPNANYRTLLHEFGHGFGLGDTYVEGVWTCQRGQPNSVMCQLKFDDLQSDDIAGVRAIYTKVFGAETLPPPEPTVVPTVQPPVVPQMFMALGAEQAGMAHVYFASSDTLKASTSYCLGSKVECSMNEHSWQTIAPASEVGGMIFKTSEQVRLAEGLLINVRAEHQSGQRALKYFQIQSR